MKFVKKYWIVLLLCVVVIIMAIIKANYGYNTETSNTKQVTRIEPTEKPKPTLIPGFELLDKIPYQGTGFVIDKYLAPNELNVKIKGIDKKLAEKMVYEWILSNNIATESYKLLITNY